MITEINRKEGDGKVDFLHPNGPRRTFNWPKVADTCYVPLSNILRVIAAPNTTRGRAYAISESDYQETSTAFECHTTK